MLPLPCMLVCAFVLRKSHARPRVQRAPGLPCALCFREGETKMTNFGRQRVARMPRHISSVVTGLVRNRALRRVTQYSRDAVVESSSRLASLIVTVELTMISRRRCYGAVESEATLTPSAPCSAASATPATAISSNHEARPRSPRS